jgi:two-component system chemotaxis sensor kinase CheA
VDGDIYAVPMNHLLETFRMEEGSVHEVMQRGVLLWRGQLVPVVDAGRLFGSGAALGRREYAIVVGAGGRAKVLLVDKPLGNQHIVVKSLDDALGKPFGIAGATLLGSGRIVMIMDTRQILDAHVDELPGVRA